MLHSFTIRLTHGNQLETLYLRNGVIWFPASRVCRQAFLVKLPLQMAVLYVCRVSFFLANFLRPPLPDISNEDNSYMLGLIFMKLDHNDVWLCPQIMHDLWPRSRSHGVTGVKSSFSQKSFNSSTILKMVMLLMHMTDLDIPNKVINLKTIWRHLGSLGSKR